MQSLVNGLGITLSAFLCIALLSACGNPGRSYTQGVMVETLEVEILPDTSKMFVYRLRWPEEAVPNHIRIAEGRNAASHERGGVSIDRNTHRRLQENAGYVVARQGYCREGFLELDRNISRYHLWLKGECKEGATAEDRERFGDKKVINVRS